jgi:hypothetical protein
VEEAPAAFDTRSAGEFGDAAAAGAFEQALDADEVRA